MKSQQFATISCGVSRATRAWLRPRGLSIFLLVACVLVGLRSSLHAQSLGNAGTIEGTVIDPTGAVVPKADVSIHNAISGYNQTVITDNNGSFRLGNLPPNPYHLEFKASGFAVFSQEVEIKNSVPVQVKVTLALAGANTTVTVEGVTGALENDPSAAARRYRLQGQEDRNDSANRLRQNI